MIVCFFFFFFFKQKTAYEMRISDWSSDVCSSDLVRLRTAPGRHVVQDWLLAGVELDDPGHVAVDRLVVGNAGARRVGDSDAAGPVDVHDPRHPQHRTGIEGERIELAGIDAAINDDTRLVAGGSSHGDATVQQAPTIGQT